MTEVERWSIYQEYIGIEEISERNIKIFYDYSRSHSYEEYVTLVKDEHADDMPMRDIILEDKGGSIRVSCQDKVVGEIIRHDNGIVLVSYEGIGDERYPAIFHCDEKNALECSLTDCYKKFDKYVLDGDYLLDRNGENTIDKLYLRFIRSNYGVPEKL